MSTRPYQISALALTLLSACTVPAPSGSLPSTRPSALPTAAASTSAPATPGSTPSAAQPTATPTAAATPTPSPSPAGLTASGMVKDDLGAVMPGVMVTARSLTQAMPYQATATTDGAGRYKFENVPDGVNLEIVAALPGYTTRKAGLAVISGGVANTVDFADVNALSQKPEIVAIDPAGGSIAPDGAFTITFSHNMDHASVEGTFAIQAADNPPPALTSGAILPVNGLRALDSTCIYTGRDYTPTWDGENRVIFRPNNQILPADAQRPIAFRLIFTAGSTGILKSSVQVASRTPQDGSIPDGPFRIGTSFRPYYTFTVPPQSATLAIDDVVFSPSEAGGSFDYLKIRFNRPLYLKLTNGTIVAGGAGGQAQAAPAANGVVTQAAAAGNYSLEVTRNGATTTTNVGTVTNPAAYYDETDTTHRTVIVKADPAVNLFQPGDSVRVNITGAIQDAAGNQLSPGSTGATFNKPSV